MESFKQYIFEKVAYGPNTKYDIKVLGKEKLSEQFYVYTLTINGDIARWVASTKKDLNLAYFNDWPEFTIDVIERGANHPSFVKIKSIFSKSKNQTAINLKKQVAEAIEDWNWKQNLGKNADLYSQKVFGESVGLVVKVLEKVNPKDFPHWFKPTDSKNHFRDVYKILINDKLCYVTDSYINVDSLIEPGWSIKNLLTCSLKYEEVFGIKMQEVDHAVKEAIKDWNWKQELGKNADSYNRHTF